MGICLSSQKRTGDKKNADIENELKKEKARKANEVKMLLLGAGESGKSTILKQMKIINDSGYSQEERESFKEVVFSNVVQSMKVLLEAMNTMEIKLGEASNEPYVKIILDLPAQIEGGSLPTDIGNAIKALWADQGVQECFARSNEFQLNDSAKYYFESIDRIIAPDFIPNEQDVLRSRVKTTGITETTFTNGKLLYRMFDVGGQRSERKKWIHCFQEVTAIIFMVAISEYDQVLVEDETVNRMAEALTLFDSICNSRWFADTSVILFLNKIDIFTEKIKRVPIQKYFDDYTGGDEYEAATNYFRERFIALNKNPKKTVYPHLTCATDTDQIKFVMQAVNDIIVRKNLDANNLM